MSMYFTSFVRYYRGFQINGFQQRLILFYNLYCSISVYLRKAVKNLKQLLMQESSVIHNQPMLKIIYKMPPISYHTEEGNLLKIYPLEPNFEGIYDSVATAKTPGEVRAGLS